MKNAANSTDSIIFHTDRVSRATCHKAGGAFHVSNPARPGTEIKMQNAPQSHIVRIAASGFPPNRNSKGNNMAICKVVHIDAFSDTPGMGNPAGVVLGADHLRGLDMQAIAKAVGFNETVFVCRSRHADYRFRFFTPGHEMNLCGHATVAAMWNLNRTASESSRLWVETAAGILPVWYDRDGNLVRMRQSSPEFVEFSGSRDALAAALGIKAGGFDPELPIVYGSTGTWTLLVPVRDEEALFAMRPDNAAFPSILAKMPRASVHPFVVTKRDGDMEFSARHFSSPYSGTIEDPVTGTASGVMGAYAMRHLCPERDEAHFLVHQGKSVGRNGRVFVDVEKTPTETQIFIAGQAVPVKEFSVSF